MKDETDLRLPPSLQKCKPIARQLFQCLLLIFLQCFLSRMLFAVPRMFTYDKAMNVYQYEKTLTVVALAVSGLLYYSLNRSFLLYESSVREAFLQEKPTHRTQRVRFLLSHWQTYVRPIAFSAALLLLPYTLSNPALTVFIQSRLWLIALLPAYMLLWLIGSLSALKYCSDPEQAGLMQRLRDPKYNRKQYRKTMLQVILVYACASFAVLPILFLLPIVYLLRDSMFLKIVLYIVGFVLLWKAVRNFRAIRSRGKVIKRLRAVCESNHYEMTPIARPYASLFFLHPGEDFRVTVEGVTYSCKLLCGKRKLTPIRIEADGTVCFIHSLNLRGVTLFSHETCRSVAYESEYKKVLLLNPVPKTVTGYDAGKSWMIDNGDHAGGFRVYTGNAFANAMERKCIERMERQG